MTQANWHSEYKSKLLGKEYMQANCAQCHTEEKFAGTPLVERGRQLFFEKACYGGHRIEGLADGILAPDLTEVGKKYRIDYLWGHTVNPRNYLATSFMPKFDLSDDEIMALVIFLKNRRGINFAETSLDQYRVRMQEAKTTTTATAPNQTATTSAARGEQLIGQRACTACHRLGDRDGHIVPDFSFEGLVRDSNWMTDPAEYEAQRYSLIRAADAAQVRATAGIQAKIGMAQRLCSLPPRVGVTGSAGSAPS